MRMPKLHRCARLALFGIVFAPPLSADITLDGSLGPAGPLPGPDFVIPHTVGTRSGGNLFHSFGTFNIGAAESAEFTGPSGISHVLSRVTGGEPSQIDGLLRSSIPDAEVYFINPNGVLFGPGAAVDVPGSFHTSTADYVRLADDTRFMAQPSAQEPLLTSAPPEAFGFLGHTTPGAIDFEAREVAAAGGATLSLIGGDIRIANDSSLVAADGQIDLIATDSPADIVIGRPDALAADSLGGEILIAPFGNIDVSGAGNGRIHIRAGRLQADSGLILADTFGPGAGGLIDIQASEVELRNGTLVSTSTFSEGTGGHTRIRADRLVANGSNLELFGPTSIAAESFGSGDAGRAELIASEIAIEDGAVITASAYAGGRGGDISVRADELTLRGEDADTGPSMIAVQTFPGSSGDAGQLVIEVENLILSDGAELRTRSEGTGRSGDIGLQVGEQIQLAGNAASGKPSVITTATRGPGRAGDVDIVARDLLILDGNLISAGTNGPGRGGNITVNVSGSVVLRGENRLGDSLSRLAVETTRDESGDAGVLTIRSPEVRIEEGAIIAARSFGPGNGGRVDILSDRVTLSGNNSNEFGSLIAASTFAEGRGADVSIVAGDLTLLDGAQVQMFAVDSGAGGTLAVEVSGRLLIAGADPSGFDEGVSAFFSQAFGDGDAGDISVRAEELLIRGGGGIFADTFAAGQAGNIDIEVGERLQISGVSPVGRGGDIESASIGAATENAGNGGNIRVHSPSITLLDGAEINSATFTSGRAGDIDVTADVIRISGRDAIDDGVASAIAADTDGDGRGGDIRIVTGRLLLQDEGLVSTRAIGRGDAGDIEVQASDRIELDGGNISTLSEQADGGNLELNVTWLLLVRNGAITTSVGTGQGNGGNLSIDPEFVILDSGRILANAFGGAGGNIRIVADQFIASPDSLVEAVAKASDGIDGIVVIDSPDQDLSGDLSPLTVVFTDGSGLLLAPCAQRTDVGRIQLGVTPYDVLPDSPEAMRAALPTRFGDGAPPTPEPDSQFRSSTRGSDSVTSQATAATRRAAAAVWMPCRPS